VLAKGTGGPDPEAVAPLGTGMAPDQCNGLPLADLLRLSGFDVIAESAGGFSCGVASAQQASHRLPHLATGLRGFAADE